MKNDDTESRQDTAAESSSSMGKDFHSFTLFNLFLTASTATSLCTFFQLLAVHGFVLFVLGTMVLHLFVQTTIT
ncbi:hypothetical protein DPMN_136475 [Dreissena polymorpha]|uniref:Uncharacterized protein n=1 Tax=Dreissena polymorpha TaxID=45954 RepID=A0A9D4G2V3_DREPO|nr:hypothetical protein DPMN_136475 [Dreissena polymorpha]